MEPEKNTPTPYDENTILKREKSKKNFSEKRKKSFPAVGKDRVHKDKVQPAHRQIFQLYKDQGFRSLGKAIRRTGVYSEGVAQRVNVITKSKSWKLLMQEYMPEEVLAIRHSELLDKRDTKIVEDVTTTKKGERKVTTRIVDMGPETAAVTKGLELAYRLRGSFSKDDTPPPSTVMYNLFYKPEVREQMRVFEDGIKTSLLNEINKRNLADIAEEEEIANDKGTGGGVREAEVVVEPDPGTGGGS